ncbi:uncharacterized protein [Physcomitrium patens]|nr:formin-G-like [Physcomitrium patens]XP_024366497.1 formin-G-like [Physcomitrium patens]|eukprot:XP_024366496.1 formin-G-like [Physcomitrella patens]
MECKNKNPTFKATFPCSINKIYHTYDVKLSKNKYHDNVTRKEFSSNHVFFKNKSQNACNSFYTSHSKDIVTNQIYLNMPNPCDESNGENDVRINCFIPQYWKHRFNLDDNIDLSNNIDKKMVDLDFFEDNNNYALTSQINARSKTYKEFQYKCKKNSSPNKCAPKTNEIFFCEKKTHATFKTFNKRNKVFEACLKMNSPCKDKSTLSINPMCHKSNFVSNNFFNISIFFHNIHDGSGLLNFQNIYEDFCVFISMIYLNKQDHAHFYKPKKNGQIPKYIDNSYELLKEYALFHLKKYNSLLKRGEKTNIINFKFLSDKMLESNTNSSNIDYGFKILEKTCDQKESYNDGHHNIKNIQNILSFLNHLKNIIIICMNYRKDHKNNLIPRNIFLEAIFKNEIKNDKMLSENDIMEFLSSNILKINKNIEYFLTLLYSNDLKKHILFQHLKPLCTRNPLLLTIQDIVTPSPNSKSDESNKNNKNKNDENFLNHSTPCMNSCVLPSNLQPSLSFPSLSIPRHSPINEDENSSEKHSTSFQHQAQPTNGSKPFCIPPPPPLPPSKKKIVPQSSTQKLDVIKNVIIPPLSLKPKQDSNTNVVVKPKFKQLVWDKITPTSTNKTVWSNTSLTNVKMDLQELESLFALKEVVPKKTTFIDRNTNIKKLQVVSILDLKRAHNVNIQLRSLRTPLPKLLEALQNMDHDILTSEVLMVMHNTLPNEDDVKLLQNYVGDVDPLAEIEKYYLDLLKIPRYKNRIKCLAFKLQYKATYEQTQHDLELIEKACNQLKSSQTLVKILEMVLVAGNHLNGESFCGSASGFKLDALLKLMDVKGCHKNTTLLHFVVAELLKMDEQVGKLSEELREVKLAANLSLDRLNSNLKELERGLEILNQEIRDIHSNNTLANSNELKFIESMVPFAQTSSKDFIILQNMAKSSLNKLKDVAMYFGEPVKGDQNTNLFKIMREFLFMFDCACNEIKKAKKHKDNAMSISHAQQRPASAICQPKTALQTTNLYHEEQLENTPSSKLSLIERIQGRKSCTSFPEELESIQLRRPSTSSNTPLRTHTVSSTNNSSNVVASAQEKLLQSIQNQSQHFDSDWSTN